MNAPLPERDIHIRTIDTADIARLASFLEPFVAMRTLLPRTLDELEYLAPNFFIAEADGEIVGCAALEIYSNKLAEVRSLAVRGDMQGYGIGRKLVQACIDLAKTRNVFEVMAITSSEQFFKSCGFDWTLPGERKALFIQTRDEWH